MCAYLWQQSAGLQDAAPTMLRATVIASRSVARSLSSSPAVADFAACSVVQHAAGLRLVATRDVATDEAIFRFSGVLIRSNTGDRCLRVGERHYLTPAAEEGEPPWVFLNHSFEPTVRLSHPPLPSGTADPPPTVLTATANLDLPAGTPLTFDYNLHEYVMFGDGFVCEETGRVVRGFHHLSPEEKEALLPRAMPFVRTLHGQHLFGSESRC